MAEKDATVVVRTYPTRQEAELGKMILAGSGVGSFLRGDDAGGMLAFASPFTSVRLVVRAEDLERAEAILGQSEGRIDETADERV